MATLNTTNAVSDVIFTYFNQTADKVPLSSRTYYNEILTSGSIIGSVQTGAIRNYTSSGNVIASIASGSSGAAFEYASVYSQYKTLLSNNTSSTQDFKMISGSAINKCTELAAMSFKKSLIGSAISMYNTNGRLSFQVNGKRFYVYQRSTHYPTITCNIDSTVMSTNVGIITTSSTAPTTLDNTTFAGLFFGQLGLAVFDKSNASSGIDFFNSSGVKFASLYNEEYINSTTYFCRVTHQKYNFSNNPTWRVLSQGRWLKRDRIEFVAIDSVGLYNDAGQLLAIGKLSYPAIKHQNKEVHIQVVLRY